MSRIKPLNFKLLNQYEAFLWQIQPAKMKELWDNAEGNDKLGLVSDRTRKEY